MITSNLTRFHANCARQCFDNYAVLLYKVWHDCKWK